MRLFAKQHQSGIDSQWNSRSGMLLEQPPAHTNDLDSGLGRFSRPSREHALQWVFLLRNRFPQCTSGSLFPPESGTFKTFLKISKVMRYPSLVRVGMSCRVGRKTAETPETPSVIHVQETRDSMMPKHHGGTLEITSQPPSDTHKTPAIDK